MKGIMTHIRKFAVLCMAMAAVCMSVSAQRRLTPAEYIEKHKNLAIVDQEVYGIPASIKMAQALLESDCGNSRLALLGNNHFGIKCKRDWTGETILHDDDALQECFRKYPSPEDSFRDHSEFLNNSARYQSLFELDPTDYKGWARGLKACGYATNPRYADMLIDLIERYELYKLDSEDAGPQVAEQIFHGAAPEEIDLAAADTGVSSKVDVDNYAVSANRLGSHSVFYNNGSEFVVARAGETYESIGGMVGVKARRLRKLNDAGPSYQPEEGEQVYIHPKAARANNGKLLHVAGRGETLRHVSQVYGIKLGKLARLNRMDTDETLREGQQIRLM